MEQRTIRETKLVELDRYNAINAYILFYNNGEMEGYTNRGALVFGNQDDKVFDFFEFDPNELHLNIPYRGRYIVEKNANNRKKNLLFHDIDFSDEEIKLIMKRISDFKNKLNNHTNIAAAVNSISDIAVSYQKGKNV